MHLIHKASLQRAHGALTTRPQRTHGDLEDPQRCHSVLSNTLWKRQAAAFVLSMLKVKAAAWRSMRLHSVSTAFAQRCWSLHIAHLGVLQFFKTLWERCKDATLVWQVFYGVNLNVVCPYSQFYLNSWDHKLSYSVHQTVLHRYMPFIRGKPY